MSDTKTALVEKVVAAMDSNMVADFATSSADAVRQTKQMNARAAIVTVLDGITELTAEMSEAKHQSCIGLKWPGRPEEMQRMIDTSEWQAMLAAKRAELKL